jgi:hypothetical protein
LTETVCPRATADAMHASMAHNTYLVFIIVLPFQWALLALVLPRSFSPAAVLPTVT